MVRIGKVTLGKGPTIALTLTDSESPQQIQKAKALGARLLEIRIDRFRRLEEDTIVKRVRSLRRLGVPLIATIRCRKEGGGRMLSDHQRLHLFKKILPWVEAIDLELSSKRLTKTLVPLAHRRGKRVILSYHNFQATPSDRMMTKLVQKGKRVRADVVKIAVTPKTPAEVARLLLFTERHRDKNLITLGMGALGPSTRILAPLFGSLVTYGFVGRPQAPGQLSVERLCRELRNESSHGSSRES